MFAGALYASPKIEQISANNLDAWLIEDHSLPIVTVKIRFAFIGSAYDPAGKQGLASFVSQMLDEGAGDLDSLAFQKALEQDAIRFSAGASDDAVEVNLQTLAEFKPHAFDLLSLALNKPRFDDAAIAMVRAGIVSELKQLGENPDYLVSLKWKQTAFAGHNYKNPRRGDLQSIANIKKVDLSGFSQLFYSPCTPKTIAIVGDITKQEAADFLDKLYKNQPELCKSRLPLPQAVIAEAKSPIIVKKDIPQSVVHASLPGLPRSDKDYYALVVLNHIFGGSTLTSRLGKEIRDRNGLAYYANSDIGLLDAANWLAISFATRNEKTYAALDLMQKEFDKIALGGVTQEEFEQAKSYLTGSFPLGLDNQGSLAAYLINMQHEELGIDYLEKRNDFINAVTLEQVNELAKKIFSKKPLIVTVGDPKEIKP